MKKKCNLLKIEDLSVSEIMDLIHDAISFSFSKKDWQLSRKYLVANLFFEPSTRTNYSFVSAQSQLGMDYVNVNINESSVRKGESLYDTCKTFESIDFDALVIRHSKNEYFKELENINIPIINAGDGSGNHPSQCLLDLLTIYQEFNTFENLNVAIIGDIKHSRVAHSNYQALKKLKANVCFSGPKEWMDDLNDYQEIDDAIKWADVVMLLRVQNERISDDEKLGISQEDYHQSYGLTLKRYELMKDNAIIMHPAPVNRDVEIADELVECKKSRIFKQMHNGVLMRKAILKRCLGEEFDDIKECENN